MKKKTKLPQMMAVKVIEFNRPGDGDPCTNITDPTSQLSLSTTHVFHM